MLLASFLNLKLAGGIPTTGPLHLPFSLPGGRSDFLTAVFPTQLSLLLGPSLAILVTVVTLPYRDPLCHHHFLPCAQRLPLLKHFGVRSCLVPCDLPLPLEQKAPGPAHLVSCPTHHPPPSQTLRGRTCL